MPNHCTNVNAQAANVPCLMDCCKDKKHDLCTDCQGDGFTMRSVGTNVKSVDCDTCGGTGEMQEDDPHVCGPNAGCTAACYGVNK